jgi:hypothetical protein
MAEKRTAGEQVILLSAKKLVIIMCGRKVAKLLDCAPHSVNTVFPKLRDVEPTVKRHGIKTCAQ